MATRLMRQRRFDGTLTYPVPLLEEVIVTITTNTVAVRTPHGLAVRYLVPESEESLYPFSRLSETTCRAQ